MSYYYCDTEKCICNCHKMFLVICLSCNNVDNKENAGVYEKKETKEIQYVEIKRFGIKNYFKATILDNGELYLENVDESKDWLVINRKELQKFSAWLTKQFLWLEKE